MFCFKSGHERRLSGGRKGSVDVKTREAKPSGLGEKKKRHSSRIQPRFFLSRSNSLASDKENEFCSETSDKENIIGFDKESEITSDNDSKLTSDREILDGFDESVTINPKPVLVRSASNPSTCHDGIRRPARPPSKKRVTWNHGDLGEALRTFAGENDIEEAEIASLLQTLDADQKRRESVRFDKPPAILSSTPSAPMLRSKTEKAWDTRGQVRPEVFRQYSTIYMLLSGDQGGEVSADLLASKLRISPSQANAMLSEADEDANGMLDFDEFVNFMVKKDVKAKVSSSGQAVAEVVGETETEGEASGDKAGDSKDVRRRSQYDWEPSDGETRRYRMLFELIDRDQNALLDAAELTAALRTDRFLQKALQGQMNEPSLETLDFNLFVSAMHEYEVTISKEFNNTLDTTPRDSRNHKVRVSINVEDNLRESTKTLLQFLRPEEASDEVNVLRALALLEATMHASTTQRRKPVSTDDYNMHFALQRLVLAKGRNLIPDREFIGLLRKYPSCQFLTKDQEGAPAGEEKVAPKAPMMVVSDETGKQMSIDEVESANALKASQENSDPFKNNSEPFDVESVDEARLILYDTVFDYIDKDGSGTLTKEDVNEAMQEVTMTGADENDLITLFALLTAVDELEGHLVYYSDFVEILEAEGDIESFYVVVTENLL